MAKQLTKYFKHGLVGLLIGTFVFAGPGDLIQRNIDAIVGTEQVSDISTPASGKRGLFPKDNGWYEIDSAGNVSKIGTGSGGGSAGYNILAEAGKNTRFEDGVEDWGVSGGGSVDHETGDTGDPIFGSGSLKWTPSGDPDDYLNSGLTGIPFALQGKDCLLRFWYYTDNTDARIGIYVGGSDFSADNYVTLSSEDSFIVKVVEFPFTCEAGGGIGVMGKSTSTDPVWIDEVYVGEDYRKSGEVGEASTYPIGSVFAHASDTCPVGSLQADGSAVSRTAYAALFNVIGTAHGDGDGSTTFNIPDYRGRFLRGWDDGAGNDPDAGDRTAMNPGGYTGDNVGSLQADAFQGHKHDLENGGLIISHISGTASAQAGNSRTTTGVGHPTSDGINGTPRTTSETRPKNAYVNYCIQYRTSGVGTVSVGMDVQSGSVSYAGAAGCAWISSSNDWDDFAAEAACPTPTAKGNGIAPSTKVPQATFQGLKANTRYRVTFRGIPQTAKTSSENTACQYRLTDGVNHKPARKNRAVDGNALTYLTDWSEEFEYDTDQDEVTFKLQSKRTAGNGQCQLVAGEDEGFEISIEPVDIEKRIAVKLDGIDPTGMSDELATKMGHKQYTENDVTVTVSNVSSLQRAVFIPYQMQDGTWRLRFNIHALLSPNQTTGTVAISGITSKNIGSFRQSLSGPIVGGGAIAGYASINENSDTINWVTETAVNRVGISGDIELEEKPEWAD